MGRKVRWEGGGEMGWVRNEKGWDMNEEMRGQRG